MPVPEPMLGLVRLPSRPSTGNATHSRTVSIPNGSIEATPSRTMSVTTVAEAKEEDDERSEPNSTRSAVETRSHLSSSPSEACSQDSGSPDLPTIFDVLAPFDLFTSLLTVVPDWIALHLVFLQLPVCTIGLTSWAWMIIRGHHFFGGDVPSESAYIGQLRQPLMRCAFKTILLLLALFFAWCDRAIFKSNTTLDDFFEFAWADPGHESAALALLVVNHLYWEAAERWMFYKKHDWQSSVSQMLADTRFKYERIIMLVYLLSLSAPIYLFESREYLYLYVIGVILLILVKTESVVENGDKFSTAIHCSGFFFILGVALALCLQRTQFLWIVKFMNVIPYFLKFMVMTSQHSIKVRTEIKMLKHLCDTMAVIIMPKIAAAVMFGAVS